MTLVMEFPTFTLENKIGGTLILQLGMVKKLRVKKIFRKNWKNQKNSSEKFVKNIIKCKITDEHRGEKFDLGCGVFKIYMRKSCDQLVSFWLYSPLYNYGTKKILSFFK